MQHVKSPVSVAYSHARSRGTDTFWLKQMAEKIPTPPPAPQRQPPVDGADPIAATLARAYAATLAEPLPPRLADLLRALE